MFDISILSGFLSCFLCGSVSGVFFGLFLKVVLVGCVCSLFCGFELFGLYVFVGCFCPSRFVVVVSAVGVFEV